MTDKSSCSIYELKLPWVISVSCSLFKDLTLCLIYTLIPSFSYLLLLVSPFFYPVPSHSCDPLEDLLPSLSQYGSASALPDDEDLEFWRSYLGIHFWLIPLFQLSVITYLLTICWICSMFNFNNIYLHGLDCTGSLGLFMKTLVSHLWTKLRKVMLWLLTQASRYLNTCHYCILWLRSTFVIYVVSTRIIWCNQIL